MKAYRFSARIEDGQLKIALPALDQMRRALKHWQRCPVTITVEKAFATRSLDANAYYFGVVLAHLADYTGHDLMELHDYCKHRFNPRVITICDADGFVVGEEVIGQTTTKLTTLTFYQYVEQIRQWMRNEFGLETPDPDPASRPALRKVAA